LTDETGAIVERFQYSPYGLLLDGDASITPFLFNGMYGVMTDSNGLYYMRARYYHPEIRRFVNQDVLLGNLVEGQTLNRYAFAFVTGRPVSFVDPFGLDGMDTAESNTASSCITDFANYTALAGGACGAIIGGGGGAIVCSPSGPGALGCGAVGIAEGALIGSGAGLMVGYFLGKIFCYMENGEELTNVPFAARNWTCKAQCNVQQINRTVVCPDRVYGTATGSSEESACREAKRDATQSTPRGCYSRHCRCICSH
jgi:RHS repeat-associated protein